MEVIHLIAVYAAPTVSRRSGLWGQLKRVIENIAEPVLIGGDFNTILRLDERSGGNGRLSPDSLAFGEWINELALVDMGLRGSTFTWRRGKYTRIFVARRLDRVLCSAQTRVRWQEAVVSHLPFSVRPHTNLCAARTERRGNPKRRPFRFEAAWLKHEGFKDLLSASWNREMRTPEALALLKVKLKKWNKEEEVLWYQKSCEKWVVLGDRNTNYYHTSTIVRSKRNKIEMLKDEDGRWIDQSEELEKLAIAYYRRLYSTEDLNMNTEKLPQQGFTAFTRDEKEILNKPFALRIWRLRFDLWVSSRPQDRMVFNLSSTRTRGK
ncbi:uncharacterized protein LOC125600751 [Brassica napus]|uniref:uncharacterized protein LOC125600751 n=1 Tax=Brassica napus TaxID=3708 RepID=UPI002078C9BA|nr:uncharacterized protein LOC125600751 [Brassica napus]